MIEGVIKMACYFRRKANEETLRLTRAGGIQVQPRSYIRPVGLLEQKVLMDTTVSFASGLN